MGLFLRVEDEASFIQSYAKKFLLNPVHAAKCCLKELFQYVLRLFRHV